MDSISVMSESRMNMGARGTLAGKQAAVSDKNFRIHYEKFRTLEDDEIAQVLHTFNYFDFSAVQHSKANTKVKTQYLGEILQMLQHNIGLQETKELTATLDKNNMGRFAMDKLVGLLGTHGFQEQSQDDLLRSFIELDDDADGMISKKEMERILKTMGEGLSDEELNYFFDLAVDPQGPPDMINIRKVTEILLPKFESTNLLTSRGGEPNAEDFEAAAEEQKND